MVKGIWDEGWGMLKPEDAFVFVDNHDNQRGHGGGGNPLSFADPYNYKKAQVIIELFRILHLKNSHIYTLCNFS